MSISKMLKIASKTLGGKFFTEKEIFEGEKIDWFLGLSYRDYLRNILIYHPIPINWLVRFSYNLYHRLRYPSSTDTEKFYGMIRQEIDNKLSAQFYNGCSDRFMRCLYRFLCNLNVSIGSDCHSIVSLVDNGSDSGIMIVVSLYYINGFGKRVMHPITYPFFYSFNDLVLDGSTSNVIKAITEQISIHRQKMMGDAN